jgi:hypothetical protein
MPSSNEVQTTVILQPQPQSRKYEVLFTGIDSGQIKIPMFQRDFVWTKEQTAKLIDSIIKGYPIGTFILWKTREELRSIRNIGNIELPDPPKGDAVQYVLDGQQRITSLYAVRKGIRITRDSEEIDYKQISINLNMNPEDDDQIVSVDPPEGAPSITVHKLLTGGMTELAREYSDHLEKIDAYRSRLTGYDFSTVIIENYPLDIACEVFTRINTGGTELTLFEIMVAKTYDREKDFDLAVQYGTLLNSNDNGKDLEDANFDTLPASTILQCVSAYKKSQVRRKDILKISRSEFVEAWPYVTDGLFRAVDFVRSYLRIPVSQLLPYNALLVPLTYFFNKKYNKPATSFQKKLLTQYFWWASLSNRFSSGSENKIAQDIERMDKILSDESPSYRGEEVQLSFDNLRWHPFSTSDSFCKAILCLYAYFQPRSFHDDSLVTLDNSWLKSTASKNYHHFFPKSYLKNQNIPDWQGNVILNITIVDDFLNKRTIKAKPPSEYMKQFTISNNDLGKTMSTHMIDDLNEFGVWDDNYEKFIEARGKRVIEELNRRLYPDLIS